MPGIPALICPWKTTWPFGKENLPHAAFSPCSEMHHFTTRAQRLKVKRTTKGIDVHVCRSRLSSIPESQPRRPWFHSCSRSHLSQLPRQRCWGRADSYRDRQMEAVMACATVIPQFNSVLSPPPDSNLSKALLPRQMPPV